MSELRWPRRALTDGTVVLRRWREEDLPQLVEICQDPEIQRRTRVPSPYTEQDARAWLDGHDEEVRRGAGLSLCVADAGDPERVLASIGVVGGDPDDRVAEVGYWVAPEARGRGVATAAVRLLARWLFEELDRARIELVVATDNVASQAVARKAGFTREGVKRSAIEVKGVRYDATLWSLLPGELRGGQVPTTTGRR